jgi:hypothetical protein
MKNILWDMTPCKEVKFIEIQPKQHPKGTQTCYVWMDLLGIAFCGTDVTELRVNI